MRALYLENIENDLIELSGDKFHHLVNVVRVKEKDELLLLNGVGESKRVVIEDLKKKSLTLKSSTPIKYVSKKEIHIAIGIPKKEALELCLKQAVELGVTKIYLIQSTFSQKMNLNEERQLSLLVSALEQSNNHWLPEIIILKSVDAFVELGINFAYFSSQTNNSQEVKKNTKNIALVIGPEAGFSESEEKLLTTKAHTLIHFEDVIMRTPTALSCGLGFLKAKAE